MELRIKNQIIQIVKLFSFPDGSLNLDESDLEKFIQTLQQRMIDFFKEDLNTWKKFGEDANDDRTYLVSYLRKDGTYSSPQLTYYIAEENKFFSLENSSSHPLVADIFCEIPELPIQKLNNIR